LTLVQYLEQEKYIQLKQKVFKMGLHLIDEMTLVFCSVCIDDSESTDICENENAGYVKAWRHVELNVKGENATCKLRGDRINETIVSVDGDRVSDLVREGKIKLCLNFFK
jgi:hypothetical protein